VCSQSLSSLDGQADSDDDTATAASDAVNDARDDDDDGDVTYSCRLTAIDDSRSNVKQVSLVTPCCS